MKVSKSQVLAGLVVGAGGIGAVIYGAVLDDAELAFTGIGFGLAGAGIVLAEGTDAQVNLLQKRVEALEGAAKNVNATAAPEAQVAPEVAESKPVAVVSPQITRERSRSLTLLFRSRHRE